MNAIPIFGDEGNLPKSVAGLRLSGVQRYPQAELGVGLAFNGPGTKATVFLYDLGLADISSDVKSEQLVDIYQRSCAEIDQQVQAGAMRDFQLHASEYLHLPPDAAEPIGLWAAFSFDPPSDAEPAATTRQISHLLVRADRGHFNKIRYTHPKDHGIEAVHRFRAFAYSAEDDRLFRRNVTGDSAESALWVFSTRAGHDQSRVLGSSRGT